MCAGSGDGRRGSIISRLRVCREWGLGEDEALDCLFSVCRSVRGRFP